MFKKMFKKIIQCLLIIVIIEITTCRGNNPSKMNLLFDTRDCERLINRAIRLDKSEKKTFVHVSILH